MACDYTALSAYLDGELGEAERARLEAHVENCTGCAQELQSLERVRAMVTTCTVPSGMHRRLLARLEDETRNSHRFSRNWVWTTLAAATVLIGIGLLLLLGPSGGGPATPPVAPLSVERDAPEQQEVAKVEPLKAQAITTPAAVESFEKTKLNLQLKGTVRGAVPQAVIQNTDTGTSATYSVGEEVAPGVSITEVRDKEVVLLSEDGQEQILGLGGTVADGKVLTGLWEGTVLASDGEDQGKVTVDIVDAGGQVTMTMKGGKPGDLPQVVLHGQRDGKQMVLAGLLDNARFRIEGNVDDAFTKLNGKVFHLEDNADAVVAAGTFELTRLSSEEALAREAEGGLDAERKAEVDAMFAPLKQYADTHEGKFPDALTQLVPDVLPDLTRYANRADRTVTYSPGALAEPWKKLPLASFQPGTDPAERMQEYESQLQVLWGSEVPWRELLRVVYSNPAATYVMNSSGITEKLNNTPGDSQDAAHAASRDRASSQNNLKQLGLVNKMFSNENRGISMAGFVSVYPEYVTDPSIYTAPWDDPGTASYELLFPACTEESIEALAAQMAASGAISGPVPDPGDLAYKAFLESTVPFIYEKRADPRDPTGRNVLFLDGHVQFVKNEDWNRIVGPFTR